MESWEDFKKQGEALQRITYTCKCGCRVVIPASVDKLICRWCGNWVYKNKKDEFKDKLKKEIRKKRKVYEKN